MADQEYTPEERRSPTPSKQRDPSEADEPTLTPEEADETAQRRASAAKEYPLADEEEIRRSQEEGGPHADVPPTDVNPPTD